MSSRNTVERATILGIDAPETGQESFLYEEPPQTSNSGTLLDPSSTTSSLFLEDTESLGQGSVPPKQLLSFTNGLALVIGLQIGAEIFIAPAQVSQHVSSPALAISVWILGGLLVWTGAASFIELGLSIPRNGGIQEYLHYCYGDFPAFMFSWIWVIIAKPCAMAMMAMVFADNLCRGLVPAELISSFLAKIVALVGFAVIVLINCSGGRTGTLLGNVFLVLKLLTIFSVALLGFSTLIFPRLLQRDVAEIRKAEVVGAGIWSSVGSYVTAVYGVLFCYGGWETIGFVAGDMRDPTKDLPRVINTAMITVMIGFTLMVTSLYIVTPIQSMRDSSTPIVDFGSTLFGAFGASLYSLIGSACALGALHANVFATARLCVAAAERSYFPRLLAGPDRHQRQSESGYDRSDNSSMSRLFKAITIKYTRLTATSRRHGEVSVYAVLFGALPAFVFIMVGTFDALVPFYGISEYIFFFGAVLGVFWLRNQGPATGSYKIWTVNLVLFCLLSGSLVLRGILNNPLQGAAIIIILLVGSLLFKLSFSSLEG